MGVAAPRRRQTGALVAGTMCWLVPMSASRSDFTRPRPPAARSVAVASVISLSLIGGAAAQPAAPFSRAERARLIRGELVTRPTTRTEGGFHYVGGTSWQRVRAPLARVWRVVQDVDRYPRLIPGVDRARLIERRGNRRLIHLRHRYALVTASYFAWVRADRASHTLHFELDRSRPHDVRAGRGLLTVEPYRGGSIVTWAVRADVGGGMLGGMLEPLLHEWILKVPWCVRGVLEPGQPTC